MELLVVTTWQNFVCHALKTNLVKAKEKQLQQLPMLLEKVFCNQQRILNVLIASQMLFAMTIEITTNLWTLFQFAENVISKEALQKNKLFN
jgi:hypothetical protein